MCQLTFINLQNLEYNRLFLAGQLSLNSRDKNGDGTGFFTKEKGIWKTEERGIEIQDLGSVINNFIVTDSPVLAHVRAATFTAGDKAIDKDHAHPFEYEKFVLAHNGSLKLQTGEENKYTGMIDTQIFGKYCEDYWKENPDKKLEEVLSEVMGEHFYGKFALLVYDKTTDRWLAARGRTATLYVATIGFNEEEESLGYVINTTIEDLKLGMSVFTRYVNLLYGGIQYKVFGPQELKTETIYELDPKKLKEVSKIKESYQSRSIVPVNRFQRPIDEDPKLNQSYEFLVEFMDEARLNYQELDILIHSLLGIPISALTLDDLAILKNHYIPEIKKIVPSNIKGLEKFWFKLRLNYGVETCYEFCQFPFFLNELKELHNAEKELQKIFE